MTPPPLQVRHPPGRNEPCPCGSGRKYKQCCEEKDRAGAREDGLAEAQLRAGLAAERRGRFEEAVGAYRAAAAFAASAERTNRRLGHLLLGLGRASEAAEALRAAAGAAPRSTEQRLDLVRALTIEKRDAEAEAQVRQALAEDGASADGWWLLGRILAEAGRFEEARAALERSLALEPRQGAVWLDLVRSCRLTEAERPWLGRMLALARTDADTDQLARLHFAIGKAHDDLEDYGEAMRHFGKANRLKAAMAPFDRQGVERRVDALIERFTPAYVASQAGGSEAEAPVLVIGMPRSGTTLVEQILSSHRDVEGAGELQFWPLCGRAFERLADPAQTADFLRRAAGDYLGALARAAPPARRIVDKNPFNFFWAGLVRMTFPRAVIVHCRRDAIDTCLSNHSTYFAPRPDFSTGLDELAFYYRQYERLMRHWRATLPEGGFVEIDYEALVADPEAGARRLIAACGLEWDEACLHPERNANIVRTASRWQARQPISTASVGRWRRYEPWLGPLSSLTA
jgi:tetratricopeptide (TPR) repeat protein